MADATSTSTGNTVRHRILLADDNYELRSTVAELLSPWWDIEDVPNGAEALAAMRLRRPDLILADIMMPQVDGLELLKEVKSHSSTQDIPVILISARIGEDSTVLGLECGADDYLTKPFSAKELIARIRTHLQLARIRSEADMQKAQLQSIIRSSPLMVMALDKRGVFTVIEGRGLESLGIKKEELIGQPYQSILTEATPILKRALAGEELFQKISIRGHHYDTYCHPLRTSNNEINGVYAISTDVTDRRNAEDALRLSEARIHAFAEAMPNMAFIADASGKIVYTNAWTYDYFGKCDIQGWDWRAEDLFHPEDFVKAVNSWSECLAGKQICQTEYRLRRCDGEYRWHLGRIVPQTDELGNIVHWFGTNTDIHDQKLFSEQLRIAKQVAETANAAKSDFLANMSHEIRTPMNGILGFADLLSEAPLDCENKSYVQRILANGKHLLQLIDDILDLSKVESGKMKIERIEFSAFTLITEVFSSIRPLAQNKKLETRLSFTSDAPERLVSDPLRLRQILMNLLSNAIKFTESGEIRTCLMRDLQDPNFFCIEVEDTGIGIDPARIPFLFQSFSQADASITRRFGGTGLGLSLSLQLATAMGGSLRVKWSRPGQGSCFELRLPIKGSPSETPRTGTTTMNPSLLPPLNLRGMRVLLAEDSADNVALLKVYLEREGVQLRVASNGAEALELAASENFDLILMDIQMPVMDGLEATRRLRAQGFKKPIVALTAHALREEVEKSFTAGCNAHISKPLDRSELTRFLSSYLPVPPSSPSIH